MKLLFSEATPDYAHYLFPYAIWALPEKGERPSDLLEAGFLPASRRLDRFYLCRHVRIRLEHFGLSSENRRILRKGRGIDCHLVPRSRYRYTDQRRHAFLRYADVRFGQGVMTGERLDQLFASPLVSHLLLFADLETGRNIGTATLFLEEPRTAFYHYAFYDLEYHPRNLGMIMMTSAVEHFARAGFHYLYLGSVYSRNALYKTQFAGAEFFNGFRWSSDLKELKHLLRRDQAPADHHLLESQEYLDTFHGGHLNPIAQNHGVKVS